MPDGFIESFLDEQNRGEIVVRVGVIRIQFQHRLETCDGFGELFLRRQREAKVVQDVGLVRGGLQGATVIADGLVPVAQLGEGVAQIVERVRIVGRICNDWRNQSIARVTSPFFDNQVPRLLQATKLFSGYRQGMPAKRSAVLPITNLVPRPQAAGRQKNDRQNAGDRFGQPPACTTSQPGPRPQS